MEFNFTPVQGFGVFFGKKSSSKDDPSLVSGWGGGYIDEPISKILNGLQSADEVKMDRWILNVERY